jgi:hypothetical protein
MHQLPDNALTSVLYGSHQRGLSIRIFPIRISPMFQQQLHCGFITPSGCDHQRSGAPVCVGFIVIRIAFAIPIVFG